MLRFLTAGESHGPALLVTLDGLPAGVEVTTEQLAAELARRRLGYGRGARQKFEADEIEILAGVRHGRSLGGPIAIRIGNSEWPRWREVMSPDPSDADSFATTGRGAPLTRPRPGHADLPGMQKYGFGDARPILERSSARETAARVAAGAVARRFLAQVLGVEIFSHVVAIGDSPTVTTRPTVDQLAAIDHDPVRCADPDISRSMVAAIDAAKAAGDTLGGVFEVIAENCPPGLGSHVQWDRRIDGRLAGAVMSIQAIKAVEFGDGWAVAAGPGSAAHDEIVLDELGNLVRSSNHAGGVEGGITNGDLLRIRAAMKPISTVPRALRTVDLATGEPAQAIAQRSDTCAVPAAAVVGEAMVALTLADAALEKFGGDSVTETQRNVQGYLAGLERGR